MSTAASVSSVGTSPQHASTTSGCAPRCSASDGDDAQRHSAAPARQWAMASSIASQLGSGFLPATVTLT